MVGYTPQTFRKAVMLLCKVFIVVLSVSAIMCVLFRYYPESVFSYLGNYVLAVLYFFLLFAFSSTYGCFKVGLLRLRELIFSYVLSVSMSNFIYYFVICLIARRLLQPVPLIILTVCEWVFFTVVYILINKLYFLLYPARDCIIICGSSQRDRDIAEKFERMNERYDIREACDEEEGYETLARKIQDYSTVILNNKDLILRERLVAYCFEHNKRLYIMPTVQDIMLNNAHETFIGDSLAYLCKNRTFSIEQLAIKRILDIVVSALAIILTSPIMLLTALIIKLQDGGSIFFRQCRLTRNGEEFMIIKFRSMIEDAENIDGDKRAKKNDERITPFGKFIRSSRIDELPQFFNVLSGEMSIVGPRAERVEHYEAYCKLYPQFSYRLKVKAGITGYAQIYGKYNTSFVDKVKMDLLYIENCSLIMDLKLLFSTLKVVCMKSSTEGFDDNGMVAIIDETEAEQTQASETAAIKK